MGQKTFRNILELISKEYADLNLGFCQSQTPRKQEKSLKRNQRSKSKTLSKQSIKKNIIKVPQMFVSNKKSAEKINSRVMISVSRTKSQRIKSETSRCKINCKYCHKQLRGQTFSQSASKVKICDECHPHKMFDFRSN